MIPGLTTLATSYALIAAVAIGIAFLGRTVSKRSLPPAPVPQPYRWASPDVILLIAGFVFIESLSLAFVMSPQVRVLLVPPPFVDDLNAGPDAVAVTAGLGGAPAADAAGRNERAVQVAGLWGRLFSATTFAATFVGLVRVRRTVRPRHRPGSGGTVWFAVKTWLICAPFILSINVLAGWFARSFDVVPDVHPLAMIGTDPNLTLVFLLSACVATPVIEELVVRGILLPWAARNVAHSVFLLPCSALLLLSLTQGFRVGPLAFFGILVLGFWALLRFGPHRHGKQARYAAVYATSVFFAAAHSVWPTPVPLFVFSLVLGGLALRTGGVAAPILVHGLLNAVSATYVLRGGPM